MVANTSGVGSTVMSTTLSVGEAQEQLPEIITRIAGEAGPYYLEQGGTTVAVLVSPRAWRRHEDVPGRHPTTGAQEQERRLQVYERKMKQLGAEFWPTPEQQARLKELVARDDAGETLDRAERQEMRRLLRVHEQMMVKRAAAMQAIE